MKKITMLSLWCLVALMSRTGWSESTSGPQIFFGPAGQGTLNLSLRYNRLGKGAQPELTLDRVRITTRFLGPGAAFKISVTTDQMWLLLNPWATAIDEIPKDQIDHRTIGASVKVSFLKAGKVVSSRIIDATVTGAFSPAVFCTTGRYCHGQLLEAAYLTKSTPNLVIPLAGTADEMEVQASAKNQNTGAASAVFASLTRPLLSGSPVHIYAQDNQEPESRWNYEFELLPFRIVEGNALKDGVPTELLYSGERASNVIQGVHSTQPWSPNFPEILDKYQNTTVCGVKMGTLDEYYDSMSEAVLLKYRYDGGVWSQLIPFQDGDVDRPIQADTAAQSGMATDPEIFQAAVIPGQHGHKTLEVAIQLQVFVDFDSAVEDMATNKDYGMGFADQCQEYTKGSMIPVGEIWDTPSKDDTSGWLFRIAP